MPASALKVVSLPALAAAPGARLLTGMPPTALKVVSPPALAAAPAGRRLTGATYLLPPRRCLRGATATVFAAKPGQDREHMRPAREVHTDGMQRSREIMRDLTMKASLWAATSAVLSVASACAGNSIQSVLMGLIACWLAYFAVKYATAVR